MTKLVMVSEAGKHKSLKSGGTMMTIICAPQSGTSTECYVTSNPLINK